jgi:hypothetical protein
MADAEKPVNPPEHYIDIGHGQPGAIVWLYRDGRVWKGLASAGTHEERWGMDAMNFWRGRYDPQTNKLSVVGPVALENSSPPHDLMQALKSVFTNAEVVQFNSLGYRQPELFGYFEPLAGGSLGD